MKLPLLGACLTLAVLPRLASATLGEPETSVQGDAATLHAQVRMAQHSAYHVHEMTLASGTVVHEYVAAGNVFAVAWSGPKVPDLRQTLGSYFPNLLVAQRLRSSGHTHVSLHQADLVIESAGHMRAFSGRAYLPAAIPGGVSTEELR